MTQRPADLPDFRRPPIAESVFGVQFDSLSRLRVTDYGRIWDALKGEYPEVEEHPPLSPVFEVFGESATNPAPRSEILSRPPLPRVFFLNRERTRLLQFQRDRLLGNWRKAGEGEEYPRYTVNVRKFREAYERFEKAVGELGIGPVVPNQCELTYVNAIPLEEGSTGLENFRAFAQLPRVAGMAAAEDGRFVLRYTIGPEGGAPVGRLIAAAGPALTAEGKRVVQFSLTARGAPAGEGFEGVKKFFDTGHLAIVRAFTELTTERMHKEWERLQ